MEELLDKVKESKVVQAFSDLDEEVSFTKRNVIIACAIMVLSGVIIGLVVALLTRPKRPALPPEEGGRCCRKKRRCCDDDEDELFF